MTKVEAVRTLRSQAPILYTAQTIHRTHKGKRLSFEDNKFLIGIYLNDAQYTVIKKSTQCGVSEYLLCRSITKAKNGRSIFYVLPTIVLGYRFIKNRLERTITRTPEYAQWQMEAGIDFFGTEAASQSMALKSFGSGVISFVGSNSSAAFTEFPADEIVIDELDECDQENILMAPERLGASAYRYEIKVGNPTFEGFGIDAEYAKTNQAEWFIKHDCGNVVHPDFFKHVVREVEDSQYVLLDEEWEEGSKKDINMICDRCGRPIDRNGEGVWIRKFPSRDKVGFHISKLFSSSTPVKELVDSFNEGLSNDTKLTRFYNADLGLGYTAKGAKVDTDMLNACKADYIMPNRCAEPCVAGVDVGNLLNVRVNQLLPDGRVRAVYIGTVRELSDIDEICRRYNVICGVIDSMPEMRLARKMVQRMRWFKTHFTDSNTRDHQDKIDTTKDVSVERTPLLDSVKEMIVARNLVLPSNAENIQDYYEQMTANVRYFDEKRGTYIWTEGSKPDHFFFAEAYALLAKRIIPALRR